MIVDARMAQHRMHTCVVGNSKGTMRHGRSWSGRLPVKDTTSSPRPCTRPFPVAPHSTQSTRRRFKRVSHPPIHVGIYPLLSYPLRIKPPIHPLLLNVSPATPSPSENLGAIEHATHTSTNNLPWTAAGHV